MKECEKFVADWSGSLSDLVSLLKNRLTCILHEISDEAAVYTVFEVLNSRGLEVSWFDRLKSMLMAVVFQNDTGNRDEIIEEVHKLWTDIYGCVGIRLGMSTESLRFAATLRLGQRPNRPLGEEDAAYLLRDQAKGSPAKVIETTKWLYAVTQVVDRLEADRRRNAVTRIAQARLVATAVHVQQDLNESERAEVLRRWENVTFRIYGMFGKDARWAVGDYVRLAWRIVAERLAANKILDELSMIGQDFAIYDAVEHLEEADCYTNWQDEFRYFLYRYEEHLAREAGQKFNNEQWNRIWLGNAADSIEHIMPQSAGDSDLVNRLGNLLVLPPKLNSKLGAKAPKSKLEDYKKTGLLVVQEVVDQISKVGWGEQAIENREAALLDWALNEWAD
jgi:hypothetical protein